MEKSIDIIVFGATGFTGKYTVRPLARITKEKYPGITWGIAGRSKEKLQNLASEITSAGLCTGDIPIIVSDAENEESLSNMLRVAKVVINCTFTDIIHSPKIVKACIETGTHYLDVSSVKFHILNLYQDYHEAAEKANVLIIPSCGYSSIIGETGMIYLERKFKGTLQSVECYIENHLPPRKSNGALVHSGTWTTAVDIMLTFKEYLALRDKILPKTVEPETQQDKRSLLFYNNGKLWFPWPGVENEVVDISQRYLQEKYAKKSVRFSAHTTCDKWYQYLVIAAFIIYYYLTYFKFFANWLKNHPRLFTLGYITQKGPSEKAARNTRSSFLLIGKGWDETDLDHEPTKATKKMSVKVSRQHPYDTTAIASIMSAITILKESSKMPKGGVIMPGAAFYKTDIIDRLKDEGFNYEVFENY